MLTPGATFHGYAKLNAAPITQEIDEDGNNPGLPLFSYYECHVSNSITHVYISQNISEPAVYVPLIQFFNSRQRGDVVHVHFNCYGGRIDAGVQILNAIQTTQAHVVGHLDGVAYSMAGVLFLACDSHSVSPYGKLMLHVYSGGGGGGKAPDQRAASAAIDDTFARIVQGVCMPFLTKREVRDMLENSRDLYFGYDEILDRMTPKEKAKPAKKKKAEPIDEEVHELPIDRDHPVQVEGPLGHEVEE